MWEYIASDTHRMKVDKGWLYRYTPAGNYMNGMPVIHPSTMVFVPD